MGSSSRLRRKFCHPKPRNGWEILTLDVIIITYHKVQIVAKIVLHTKVVHPIPHDQTKRADRKSKKILIRLAFTLFFI